MLVAFVLIYSPIAEVSLVSMGVLVVNYLLRTLLYKPIKTDLKCFQGSEWDDLILEIEN